MKEQKVINVFILISILRCKFMISDRVYFGKGKIKGIVAISRKYWDEGTLSSNKDKLIFSGEKSTTEIPISDIKTMELVKHRTFKVIKITKLNDEFYHISSVPQFNQYDPDFSEISEDVKRQNKALYNAIDRFLNS